jgi:hypothetical protein
VAFVAAGLVGGGVPRAVHAPAWHRPAGLPPRLQSCPRPRLIVVRAMTPDPARGAPPCRVLTRVWRAGCGCG